MARLRGNGGGLAARARRKPAHASGPLAVVTRERLALAALAAAQVVYGRGSRSPAATRSLVGLMLATSALEARAAGDGRAMAAAGAVGFGAELVGVATGRPFGEYRYSDRLGPRVGGVPLLAAGAWALMARPAWVVAGLAAPRHPRAGSWRRDLAAPARSAARAWPGAARGLAGPARSWPGRAARGLASPARSWPGRAARGLVAAAPLPGRSARRHAARRLAAPAPLPGRSARRRAARRLVAAAPLPGRSARRLAAPMRLPIGRVVLAAGALTAWDVFLDPRMAREGYWSWPGGGRYEGVPLSNFAGWFATGLAVFAAYAPLARGGPSDEALAFYAWAWAGEAFANAALWGRPRVAAAGGIAMGAFAAPALARRLGR